MLCGLRLDSISDSTIDSTALPLPLPLSMSPSADPLLLCDSLDSFESFDPFDPFEFEGLLVRDVLRLKGFRWEEKVVFFGSVLISRR